MDKRVRDALHAGSYESVLSLLRSPGGQYDLVTLRALLPQVPLDHAALDGQSPVAALCALASEVWNVDERLGVSMFRRAAELGFHDAIKALGEALNWMEDHESAIPWLKRAILVSDGDTARLKGLLGESLWARRTMEDSAKVERLLREGMRDSPEFGLVLARVLLHEERREEARQLLEELVQKSVYGAALLLGNLLSSSLGDRDQAEQAYLAGIASGDAHSAHNLAVMLLELGDDRRADEYHRLAQKMGDLSALE